MGDCGGYTRVDEIFAEFLVWGGSLVLLFDLCGGFEAQFEGGLSLKAMKGGSPFCWVTSFV